MPYIPREGSLPERVIAYLQQAPKEELSAAEIAAMFDVKTSAVQAGLAAAVAADILCLLPDDDGTNTWSAGPSIGDVPRKPHSTAAGAGSPAPASPFNAWLKTKGEASAEGRAKPAPLPDPASITIEKGVALPPPPMPKPKRAAFSTVFGAMVAGDSFALPGDAAKRIAQAAGRFAKAHGMKFALRIFDDGSARLWRTE